MRERGLCVDRTAVWRRVQRYARDIDKRMRPYLKISGTSYRLGETYYAILPQLRRPTSQSLCSESDE